MIYAWYNGRDYSDYTIYFIDLTKDGVEVSWKEAEPFLKHFHNSQAKLLFTAEAVTWFEGGSCSLGDVVQRDDFFGYYWHGYKDPNEAAFLTLTPTLAASLERTFEQNRQLVDKGHLDLYLAAFRDECRKRRLLPEEAKTCNDPGCHGECHTPAHTDRNEK